MAIRQRTQNGPWYLDISFRDQSGKKKKLFRSSGTKNKKEAERLEREWKKRLHSGPSAQVPNSQVQPAQTAVQGGRTSAPFSGFAKKWFDQYVVPNNKPSAQESKRYHIKEHLAPFFGHGELAGITAEQIEALKAKLVGKSLNPKTINNILGTLRTMLTAAVDWEYLEKSPMDRIKPLKVEKKPPSFFTTEEGEKFLSACAVQRPEWYAFFLASFVTGMRRGELLALQWGDIDLDSRVIKVQRSKWQAHLGAPKSGRFRTIPIHPALYGILADKPKKSSVFVFCQENGQPFEGHHVQKAFVRISRLAGVRPLRFHDVRHSFASHLVMNGTSIKTVQELLGHSDVQTTMIYAHVLPATLACAVDGLKFGLEEKERSKSVANGSEGPILHVIGEEKSQQV